MAILNYIGNMGGGSLQSPITNLFDPRVFGATSLSSRQELNDTFWLVNANGIVLLNIKNGTWTKLSDSGSVQTGDNKAVQFPDNPNKFLVICASVEPPSSQYVNKSQICVVDTENQTISVVYKPEGSSSFSMLTIHAVNDVALIVWTNEVEYISFNNFSVTHVDVRYLRYITTINTGILLTGYYRGSSQGTEGVWFFDGTQKTLTRVYSDAYDWDKNALTLTNHALVSNGAACLKINQSDHVATLITTGQSGIFLYSDTNVALVGYNEILYEFEDDTGNLVQVGDGATIDNAFYGISYQSYVVLCGETRFHCYDWTTKTLYVNNYSIRRQPLKLTIAEWGFVGAMDPESNTATLGDGMDIILFNFNDKSYYKVSPSSGSSAGAAVTAVSNGCLVSPGKNTNGQIGIFFVSNTDRTVTNIFSSGKGWLGQEVNGQYLLSSPTSAFLMEYNPSTTNISPVGLPVLRYENFTETSLTESQFYAQTGSGTGVTKEGYLCQIDLQPIKI